MIRFLTTLTVAVAVSLSAFGQQLYDQKDPFTGLKSRAGMISLIKGAAPTGPMLMFTDAGGKTQQAFVWMAPAGTFEAAEISNVRLLIKFDDGSIKNVEPDLTLSKISNTSIGSSIAIGRGIDEAELQYYIEHPITVIRLSLLNGTGPDFTLNDGQKKEVQKAATYIMKR